MSVPSVIGYMPLCATPRSSVCDEQGVGQWPMWKRFDTIKGIVEQYIDEPYRDFLALPYHEIDKLKAEEFFYWYTPRCDIAYSRMSRTGDDHGYYKDLLKTTMNHYQSAVERLKREGKTEDADFLQLSLKYAGESEDNVFCGDDRVVVTVWGMRSREKQNIGKSILTTVLTPEAEIYTVRFELGTLGKTGELTELKKIHGSKIKTNQVPKVSVVDGYEFIGWDNDPDSAVVTSDCVFTAKYTKKQPKVPPVETPTPKMHKVRFIDPDGNEIKVLDVEHGNRISAGLIPQLPTVNGVLCTSWDKDPLKDEINADCDYTAVRPEEPKKEMHTVRFLTPDKREILKTELEHGTRLVQEMIPQLPVVNGKVCPSWDTEPLGEIVLYDRDFTAIMPQGLPEQEDITKTLHNVRFLNPDGSEVVRMQVPHGSRLQSDQIPSLPVVDNKMCRKWSPNPAKQVINKDTDFVAKNSRSLHWPWKWGLGSGNGWRWLFYIVIVLLIILLVLYIMYRCNPCSA